MTAVDGSDETVDNPELVDVGPTARHYAVAAALGVLIISLVLILDHLSDVRTCQRLYRGVERAAVATPEPRQMFMRACIADRSR